MKRVMLMGRRIGKSQMGMAQMIQRTLRTYTPWTYLEELVHSDRAPEHNEQWMTEKLRKKFPGNYRVEKYAVPTNGAPYTDYHMVFENPAEETMFRIKWS